MAVIVMDMNMPTNCSWCEFSNRLDNARTYCTRNPFEKPVNDGEDRPEYCPLKEVKMMNERTKKLPREVTNK